MIYRQRPLLIILCVRKEVRGGCFPTADFFGLKTPRVSEMLRWRWGDGGGCGHSAAPKALSLEQHLVCEGQAHPGRISLVARRGVSDTVAQFSDQTLVPKRDRRMRQGPTLHFPGSGHRSPHPACSEGELRPVSPRLQKPKEAKGSVQKQGMEFPEKGMAELLEKEF